MAQYFKNFELKSGEELEDLQLNNLKIIQNENLYRFTSDSVLLSNFVKTGPKDNVLELCSGCGVISILVNEKYKPKSIVGIDIDKNLVDMANRSLLYNRISNINFICDDAKNIVNYVNSESFDIVVCNPPYYVLNKNEKVDIKYLNAKYETQINLDAIFNSCNKTLKYGGKFFICFTPSRVQELITIASKYKFVLKKMQFVYPKNKKQSCLVLCAFTKNGNINCDVLKGIII